MAGRAVPHAGPATGDGKKEISMLSASEPRIGADRLAFAGLFLFTLLLYARPNEMLPGLLGDFPLVKIVAILTLATYGASRLFSSERLVVWPFEMKMLALIVLLGLALVPLAASPQDSIDTLTESFFKVVTVFVLMVNLIDDRARLRLMIKLVAACGAFLSLCTLTLFLTGDLDITHVASGEETIMGETIFANTNELAMALDLILPLAVVLALTSKGRARLIYFAAAGLIGGGVVLTFSRGGFLGLIAMGGVLMWKAGRGKRGTMLAASVLLLGVFLAAMPSGYADRLFTIFRTHEDPTNSAQERQALLVRAIEVAAHHPLIGVGIGNFPIYSLQGKVAHNSYIEISAELGVAGLLAYLAFIFAPLRSLRLIERKTYGAVRKESLLRKKSLCGSPEAGREDECILSREFYYLSVGLQAMIVAYMVCSFFASSQYHWYLYYTVAYAVSLKRIYAAAACAAPLAKKEIFMSSQSGEPSTRLSHSSPKKGVLWEPARTKKGTA